MSGKTRHASGTKISEYLGGGQSLLQSELPTVKACMRAALDLQEQKFLVQEIDRREYTVQKMMEELVPQIKSQWEKANYKLTSPVIFQDKTIVQKLVKYWGKVIDFANGRMNKQKQKDDLQYEMDRLLD